MKFDQVRRLRSACQIGFAVTMEQRWNTAADNSFLTGTMDELSFKSIAKKNLQQCTRYGCG
jgi:hypothetical protein